MVHDAMGVNRLILFVLFAYSATASVEDRYYPRYHLAPPRGWMNDPNGFCVYNNEYHLFYQHNPHSSFSSEIVHWGHAKSTDMFNWEHLPVALYPDKWYDRGGVFSGSALVENDTMYLYYTGNVNLPGEDPDHQQQQILAISTDGQNIMKPDFNPILNGIEFQPDFRDPKVWKHGNTYYMVLGTAFHHEESNSIRGRVILFVSKDKLNWSFASILDESDGSLGYMWECPDFFELDGRFVLLFSPQGVSPSGDKYKNLYQTGYIIGDFDYRTNIFTPRTEFIELDHGHDYYATQTILDKAKRRIVVAWFDMWDQHYPEERDGFTGQITIPRVLSLTKDNRLIQKPVKEISSVRGLTLYTGKAPAGTVVTLNDNAAEVDITAPKNKDLKLFIESSDESSTDQVVITYDYLKGQVSLDRGGQDGIRRTKWRPRNKLYLKVFIDASSLELFFGDGEVVFSSRFFPAGPISLRLDESSEVESMRVYEMKRTVIVDQDAQ